MRTSLAFAALATLVPFVLAQQVGTNTAETHPSLTYSECTASGCTQRSGKVVLDANWRWLHSTSGTTNCYDGNTWDATLCPDNVRCAANCALEGADYRGTYGISTSGNALTLTFVTTHQYGTNVGSRVYLMENDTTYKILKLLGQEFTFDVDVSKLGCGLNGALYLVEMDADGGMAKYPTNKAGAKYGTGYCDAQCPRDMKFIAGKANVEGWAPSANDKNAGKGNAGTCCPEMDIWEANSMGAAFTPHPCSKDGLYRCEGLVECGDNASGNRYEGICDKDGCDFSHYRMGDPAFYGKGKIVDTNKPFTVVTQFITDNGSTTGNLREIRRLYVQDGRIIYNSQTNYPSLSGGPYDSITDQFCAAQKTLFGDHNEFRELGGMTKMGASMARGHVLVMSVWDDYEARMLWLDSAYPLDKDPSEPGVTRGECSRDSGHPQDVESEQASATVKFSNIRWGPIGSTYTGTAPSTTTRTSPRTSPKTTTRTTTRTSPKTSPVSPTPSNCRPYLQQCGGSAYNGARCCLQGTCTYVSSWYSQCR